MTDLDSLMGMFDKIVLPFFKYAVPRLGKVVDRVEDKEGRVLVLVPSLGWDTKDKGAWCFPSDKKSLVVPEIGTYVLVEWVDMNPDIPIYRGISGNMKDQIPEGYDGDPKTNILFQGSKNDIIKYKEGALEIISKEILLGNDPSKGVARVDDTTTSSSTEDSTFWTFWSSFFGIVTGPLIPEPGNGSPSAFQTALKGAIALAGGTPTKQDGKITSGSESIKAGD